MNNPNLKTSYCNGCGLFMYYPYQSKKDKKLYHLWCLPEDVMQMKEKEENSNANN